jgi:hypothetical protein
MQVCKKLLNQSRQLRSLKKHFGTDLKTYSNKLRITLCVFKKAPQPKVVCK